MDDRLFVAVPLTESVGGELEAQLGRSFPAGLPGREVPAANWHLTLKFLGATPAAAAAQVRGELAAGGMGRPFTITLGALGAFPDPRRARIVWVGVTSGAPSLVRLAYAVGDRLERVGIAADARRYSPHLTLSRLREVTDLRAALGSAAPPRVELPVTEVVLYRSHLGGGPPRYEVVERFPL